MGCLVSTASVNLVFNVVGHRLLSAAHDAHRPMPTHPPSHLLAQLVSSNLFQQLAPLIVFLLVPALVLTASAHRASLRRPFDMVLDVLSAVLPWNWAGGSSSEKERERRKLKKKGVRTRAEQVGLGKDGAGMFWVIPTLSLPCFDDNALL